VKGKQQARGERWEGGKEGVGLLTRYADKPMRMQEGERRGRDLEKEARENRNTKERGFLHPGLEETDLKTECMKGVRAETKILDQTLEARTLGPKEKGGKKKDTEGTTIEEGLAVRGRIIDG